MVFDLYGKAISDNTSVMIPLIPITMDYVWGCSLSSHDTFWKYRTTPLLSVNGDTTIRISGEDAETVGYFNIYEYAEVTEDYVTYLRAKRNLSFVNGEYDYTPESGVKYFRVMLVLIEQNTKQYKPLEFISNYEIRAFKSPKITDDNAKIRLSYIVDGDTYTSGQLLLPPNYSIHRNPCPLVVVLHGTSSMNTWEQAIGTNSGKSTRYLLDYLTNEGFAVFDCYVFTSKYYSPSYQNQAAPLPVFLQAYTAGIKYVCDNFNVDINNVFAFAMSAGGNLAHMALHGFSDVNFRAVAMLCPSTGFASLIFRTFFLHKSMRSLVVNYLGLQNETGASTFINTNSGLDNETCVQFVENHLDKFAGLICGAIGANGATFEDQYEWMMTGVTTLPQWMQDLNLPSIPSGWTHGIPSLINHPEVSAVSVVPVKFWQAFDDVNVSGHTNYTIYQWLKNGGSNIQWRTLPNNTGGHHAVDTSATALVSSGTTRLGIAYSDIATAYVEMADFFYQNMAQ